MNLSRRDFLSGCFALSVGLSCSRSVVAAVASNRDGEIQLSPPPLILRFGTRGEAQFVAALQHALVLMEQSGFEEKIADHALLKQPTQLMALLQQLRGRRIITCLDDSSGSFVFEDVLRSLGVSLWVHGSHLEFADGSTQHDFQTTGPFAGAGTALHKTLAAEGASYVIRESMVGWPTPLLNIGVKAPLSHPAAQLEWSQALGQIYAAGAQRGFPAPFPIQTGVTRGSAVAGVNSATSFIMDI